MLFIRAALCCCFLFFCNVTCNNIKILKYTETSSKLHRDARELAEMCFKSGSNPMIISADLLVNNRDPGGNPVVVINHKFQKQITGFISGYPTYVLSFEWFDSLKAAIDNFRRSTLWSIKSPFLIVESKSRCLNSVDVLEFMWKQDLLASYYLCSDGDTMIVFTLNPFASYAPAPWVLFHKFGDKKAQLTLYGIEYVKVDSNICKSMTFDKTQKLDRPNVKLAAFIDTEKIPREKVRSEMNKYLSQMNRKNIMTVYKILSHANTTTSTLFFSYSTKRASFQNGYIRQLPHKTIDVVDKTHQLADTNYKYVDILAQYREDSYSILTKKSNYLSTVSQVTCNYQFLFLTILMLMLIGIIVIINNKFDISRGMLDVMSLTAGMGVITPLDRLSMRIIYISGFLFVFTVMPEFQGQVSAIMSKPLRRNVESLRDLYDNKYHVYFDGILSNDMINEKLWVADEDKQYLHASNHSELFRCIDEAQFNHTIACIELRSLQLAYLLQSNDLHVSSDVIIKKYFIYWVRKDWNLKDKVDKVSSWSVESGFLDRMEFQDIKYYSEILKSAKRIKERSSFEYIDLDTLILSYMVVLGLSLWGMVAFGFELLFHKYTKRRRQILIRRRYRMELRSPLEDVSSIHQIIPSNPGTSFGSE